MANKPPLFDLLTEELAYHFGPQAAAFADRVFSMHDVDELKELMRSAGFRDVNVQVQPKDLSLPAPADFLWQYIYSTPLAQAASQASQKQRNALARDVCGRWQGIGRKRLDAVHGRYNHRCRAEIVPSRITRDHAPARHRIAAEFPIPEI